MPLGPEGLKALHLSRVPTGSFCIRPFPSVPGTQSAAGGCRRGDRAATGTCNVRLRENFRTGSGYFLGDVRICKEVYSGDKSIHLDRNRGG